MGGSTTTRPSDRTCSDPNSVKLPKYIVRHYGCYDCMTQSVKQHVGERSHWQLEILSVSVPGYRAPGGCGSQANREITWYM